jgi:hypothetical protein
MTKKNFLAIITRPAETLITLFLSVFLVTFTQLLIVGLLWLYTYEKPSPSKLSSEPQHTIDDAGKPFLPDGTLHLIYRLDTQHSDDFSKEEITDVNGQILWQGPRKECPFKYLDWSTISGNFSELQMMNLSSLTPDLSSVLEVPVWNDSEVQDVWRYDSQTEVFKGYNLKTGLIGYLGPAGFSGQAQPFGKFKGFASWTDDNPSSVTMLWQTARQIYQIDFRNRTVEKLFESEQTDINSITMWHQWREKKPNDLNEMGIIYRPLLCCLTTDNKYHLILRQPNQTIAVNLPEQWRANDIELTATTDAVFLKYYDTNFSPPKSFKLRQQYIHDYKAKPQPKSIQLYKAAYDGKLRLVNRFDWIKPKAERNLPEISDRVTVFHNWIRKVSPPVFDLLVFLFDDGLHKLASENTGLISAYAQLIITWWPDMNFLSYTLILILLAITIWHGWARRTSWSRMILWLIIVGAFNLAGLLTYLGLNHTPVIKCPICGKKRGLEKLNCARCGNALPIPQRRPTDLILAF